MAAKHILKNLETALEKGEVTREQVLRVLNTSSKSVVTEPGKKQNINFQKIFYYIGGLVLLVGIVFFVGQYWSSMSDLSRMVLTIGATLSSFCLGYYFYTSSSVKEVGRAFLGISAVLLPLAVTTALVYWGFTRFTNEGAIMVASFLFMLYFGVYRWLKADLFLPFAYIAATTAFFNLVGFLVKSGLDIPQDFEYRFLLTGIAYLLSTAFFSKSRDWKIPTLNFFGSLMTLSTIFYFQGDKLDPSFPWTLTFFAALLCTYYASVRLQSRVLLIMATLFTFGQIFKYTSEYFSNSIGWPISLMIAGILMMCVGYLSFALNKRYVRNE